MSDEEYAKIQQVNNRAASCVKILLEDAHERNWTTMNEFKGLISETRSPLADEEQAIQCLSVYLILYCQAACDPVLANIPGDEDEIDNFPVLAAGRRPAGYPLIQGGYTGPDFLLEIVRRLLHLGEDESMAGLDTVSCQFAFYAALKSKKTPAAFMLTLSSVV